MNELASFIQFNRFRETKNATQQSIPRKCKGQRRGHVVATAARQSQKTKKTKEEEEEQLMKRGTKQQVVKRPRMR